MKNEFRRLNYSNAEIEFFKENCNYSSNETIFLSFDIDWVPDYMIELTANLVSTLDVSFMQTHDSKMSRQISNEFSCGIHPNLLTNSDQGQNINQVIEFHQNLNNDFTTSRFHVLKFGYPDLVELSKAGTKLDSSVILFNGKNILPTYHSDLDMIMAPYFWEDGIYLQKKKGNSDDIIDWDTRGLKVFDFHPLDIYLNTYSIDHRNEFKKNVSKLQYTDEIFSSKFINTSFFGTRDILKSLIEKQKHGQLRIKCLTKLNKEFRETML